MRWLVVLFLPFSLNLAHAADCGPIAAALAKQAVTPARVYMTERTWNEQGVCRVSVTRFSQNIGGHTGLPPEARDMKFLPTDASCNVADRTTLKGEVADHYYAIETLPTGRMITEFWISPDTGLILKRFVNDPRKEVSWSYDFKDIHFPF
jgi:hypothetical protein